MKPEARLGAITYRQTSQKLLIPAGSIFLENQNSVDNHRRNHCQKQTVPQIQYV
jgi:hypothetical protein